MWKKSKKWDNFFGCLIGEKVEENKGKNFIFSYLIG